MHRNKHHNTVMARAFLDEIVNVWKSGSVDAFILKFGSAHGRGVASTAVVKSMSASTQGWLALAEISQM